MKKILKASSASGNNSQPQFSNSTGQTANTGATSPSLLPTPTARGWKSGGGIEKPTGEPGFGHSITIVTGGFPCQPFSHAGRRKGTADDRYQWPNMFEIIRNVKPDWVIAENVRGLVTWNDGMVLEQVCADMESEGYEVQPLIIPAVAVGAPHRRDRVWIIANRNSGRQRLSRAQEINPTETRQPTLSGVEGRHSDATDSRPQRRQSRGGESLRPTRQESERSNHEYPDWSRDWREVALTTCNDAVDDGISRTVDGVPYSRAKWRKDSLKAYGNAIVPQVAMQIFSAIKRCEYGEQI